MRLDKKIKDLPWPDCQSLANAKMHFTAVLRWPVVDHEKLLVIDFIRNRKCEVYGSIGRDFRLVLSKKNETVRVLYKGDRQAKRKPLREMLYGFGTSAAHCFPNISEHDEKALRKWLDAGPVSANHYMPELNTWVMESIDREVLAEKDAKGEIRDEAVELCPDELPAGIAEYIRREVLPFDNVLLYKKGNVRGRCFLCGEAVRAVSPQRFRQTEHTKCPNCGEVVRCFLETNDSFKVDYVANIATMQLGTDGKTVFFRQWHLLRDTTAQWENVEGQLKEIARYAVRGEKVAKWLIEAKHNWFMNTWREQYSDWTRTRDVSKIYDGSYEFYLPEDWKEQLSGTSLRYIDFEGYLAPDKNTYSYRNVIRFAIDWARYPAMEKLWKAGYVQLVHRRVIGMDRDFRGTIRWRADTIPQACKIPMRHLRTKAPGEWEVLDIDKTQKLLEEVAAGSITEQDMLLIERSNINLDYFRPALGHATVHKILKYLDGERKKEEEKHKTEEAKAKAEGRHYYGYSSGDPETYRIYRDYLRECVLLSLDLNDRQVLFPPNLDLAHARTTSQVKYEANKEKRAAFAKQVKKLEKLCMEDNGLLIRPAKNATELIAEGRYLHHCVGGYADRMANGTLAIMLIRRKDDPDTPYYTLEWREKKVIQCKTMHNGDYRQNQEVSAFVDKWMHWAAGGGKKKKTTKVA